MPDHSIERVVPTGHAFLLIELDNMVRHTFDNETLEAQANFAGAWFSGVHQEYLSISAHERSQMLVVQFKPYGAAPFLSAHMQHFANKVTSGANFLEGDAIKLREDLATTDSVPAKFQLTEAWLHAHLCEADIPPQTVIDVTEALIRDPHQKLSAITDQLEGTQKHLIDQFKRYVGITPKTFAQIQRFNRVFAQLQSEAPIDWAQVAAASGYSDQSHFIREFRRFSGFNPAQFTNSGIDNDAGNFFPLN